MALGLQAQGKFGDGMESMLNLVKLFDSLQPPSTLANNQMRFAASRIARFRDYRLAADVHGMPALLIAIESQSLPYQYPIIIANLSVEHDVECHIIDYKGNDETGRFSVVRCTGRDHLLHVYFLRIMETLVVSLGNNPAQNEVNQAISKIVELFRAMTKPSRKTIQGLWAELFVIARAHDPAALIAAWHATPGDLFDFGIGSQRVEVKSAATHIRQHHFRFEQLHPPRGTTVLVASLLVQRLSQGSSLNDLIDEVRLRVPNLPHLLFSLDQIVGLTLGDNWSRALDERYDYEMAAQSLAFFESRLIPSIGPDIPMGVDEIHFRADLTGIPMADQASYKALGSLFQAVLQQ